MLLKKYRLILVVLGFLILAAIVWLSNPSKIIPILYESKIELIIFGLSITTLEILVRALKWMVLIPEKIRFFEILPINILGITISNFTPGKVVEPIKAVILKMKNNTSVSSVLPSIIWERVLDVVVMIFFSVIFIVTFSLASDLFYLGSISILIFLIVISVFISILKFKYIGMKFFAFSKKFPVFNRISQSFVDTFYATRSRKRNYIYCITITVIAWILDGLVFYFAFLSIGIELNILAVIGVVALSVLIGFASFLPGGIGSTEVVMAVFFGLIGIESSSAIAGILLARLMTFWYGSMLGGISFLYLSRKIDLKNIL